MHDPSHPVFETTDAGYQVAGTGLPRLQAAARAGERVSRGKSRWDFMRRRRDGVSARRADLYAREEGPGRISRLTRLRMDLWNYGAGKTKDAYGTEADVRAISGRDQSWAGFKLRVLTQNLWALPVISRCLEARVHAFAKTLGGGWDVIALQEVWHARERDALRRAALSAGLRYSRHFEKGCGAPLLGAGSGGTGMMVLSRFPISESFFWRFSANGQPYQMKHCDYLGGKGVGLVRLHTPAGAVDLYVSHLHADYDRARGSGSADRYKAHRVAQAFELAHIIRLTSKSPLVLLLSDLNSGPGSMPYGLQRSVAGLGDAFAQAKPRQAGHTCEALDNVFSNRRDPPIRLDYVLFKAVPPPLCAPQAIEPTWELRDCWVHTAYVPEQDAEGLLPPGRVVPSPFASASAVPSPAPSLTASPSRPTSNGGARSSPSMNGLSGNPFRGGSMSPGDRSRAGHFIDGVGGGGVRRGAGRGAGAAAGAGAASVVRRVNLSDHHGVAAEFVARDLEGDGGFDDVEDSGGEMPPTLSLPLSQPSIGGICPQGPLLARALTEIDRGIEAATARRISHLRSAKAVVVVWVAIVVGSTVVEVDGPMGLVTRAAAGTLGGFLCAAASVLFLAYWFSAKEELQGLKEVFQTATNYERHLPMEEAFPDGGFDTSQFNTYMEHHFR